MVTNNFPHTGAPTIDIEKFTKFPNWIFSTALKSNTCMAYLALLSFDWNGKRVVWPSVPTIAAKAHISVSSAYKALHELEHTGLITIEARYGDVDRRVRQSNQYHLEELSQRTIDVLCQAAQNKPKSSGDPCAAGGSDIPLHGKSSTVGETPPAPIGMPPAPHVGPPVAYVAPPTPGTQEVDECEEDEVNQTKTNTTNLKPDELNHDTDSPTAQGGRYELRSIPGGSLDSNGPPVDTAGTTSPCSGAKTLEPKSPASDGDGDPFASVRARLERRSKAAGQMEKQTCDLASLRQRLARH
jgi:predicted transcriptional regulator